MWDFSRRSDNVPFEFPAPRTERPTSDMSPLEAPAKPGVVTDGPAAEGPVQVGGITMAHQDKLPHLPIPPLDDTMKRYLRALEGLQVSHPRPTISARSTCCTTLSSGRLCLRAAMTFVCERELGRLRRHRSQAESDCEREPSCHSRHKILLDFYHMPHLTRQVILSSLGSES